MEQKFTIEGYGKKSVFASFLPGIAGIRGIPIWCYYVNRGQCVVSFGVENKDHAIMEFYPAHTAYQNVKRTGFRTFIKKDGKYIEPFAEEEAPQKMVIGMNSLKIEEEKEGLSVCVDYFILPGERLGALVRKVAVKNISEKETELELLDGMPAAIPYGISMGDQKNMVQTAKAWMQAEDLETKVPYLRVRASLADSAAVNEVKGGNFGFAVEEDGTLLSPIVEPERVFGYDCSLGNPVGFKEETIEQFLEKPQQTKNILPCLFFAAKKRLAAQEEYVIYEVIGQVESKECLAEYRKTQKDGAYFEAKKEEAEELTRQLGSFIETKTASSAFDTYCEYTYMDNVMRGGLPIRLGKDKLFYVYSRKHGDLERDYNYFSMLPECYSQGNGNYRDVNQNRRCDTFFAPFVERENIKAFYSLIQLDGYNPLGVEKKTYRLERKEAEELFKDMEAATAEHLLAFVTKAFTPGALLREIEEVVTADSEKLFSAIIDAAKGQVNGNFGEGYWSDHWTYNLDLLEDYLEIYPEKEKEMLYEEDYTYFLSHIKINPRKKRYAETEKGLRQYNALQESSRREPEEKLVRTAFGEGEIAKVTLMEKLLLLCVVKFATLDACCMGVEMEGGKPGWYDALNGLPGILGSSVAETYELDRMLDYTIKVLEKYEEKVEVTEEVGDFLEKLWLVHQEEQKNIQEENTLSFWNRSNDIKEDYREKTFQGISGKKKSYDSSKLAAMLREFKVTVEKGIERACQTQKGICPTYFSYEVPEYEKTKEGINPLKFVQKSVPLFLEGVVRYMKLKQLEEKKRELYENVKKSDLYDEKLQMYKVNASLEEASFELGRARAFTPGWLENESIWLHMEYKYLLELLKNGMYQMFFEDFHKAAVPFLDAKVYGRSIYENSSFIASSKNPDSRIHGKGFVARLSGSTIEFISMWKRMFFGEELFSLREGQLIFAPRPVLAAYLVPEDGRVECTLLGSIKVTYCFPGKRDYIPGNYRICGMKLTYENGKMEEIIGEVVAGKMAEEVREGKVREIIIKVE